VVHGAMGYLPREVHGKPDYLTYETLIKA
jgi:hypothetical protein